MRNSWVKGASMVQYTRAFYLLRLLRGMTYGLHERIRKMVH